MPERINCPPSTSMIRSMIETRLPLKVAIGELVDNSFDKGAKTVRISNEGREVTVEDDGRGVASLPVMVTYGKHQKEEDDDLTVGRYGVGFKEAVVWLGRFTEVDTRHNGYRRSTLIDWPELERTGNWIYEFSDPVREEGDSFTCIRVSGLYKNKTRGWQKLPEQLGYIFGPGLLRGMHIILDDQEILPAPLPELSDVLTVDDVFDGCHFRLTAGLLTQPSMRRGYDVAYKYRLIRQGDEKRGFGDYSCQRFYGYIELLDDGEEKWNLSKHKEDFADYEDLYEQLYPLIEPLLQKADSMGEEVAFRQLGEEISSGLQAPIEALFKERRNRREKPEPGGSKESEPSGRQRHKATNVHYDRPGHANHKSQGKRILIKFDHVNDPDGKIGWVQTAATTVIVHLDPDNPFIATRNRDMIIATVCALLANEYGHEFHLQERRWESPDHWSERVIGIFTNLSQKVVLTAE